MALRVVLVDDEPERIALLDEALKDNDCLIVAHLGTGDELAQRITQVQADIIVVDIASPNRDILENMREVTFGQARPVVMFSQDGNSEMIRAAIEAGVSAYVVDGLKPERVRPILDVAIARFAQFQDLRSQLNKAQTTLAERKLVEKAKGILMKRRQCDEDAAYRTLRKMAMDQKARLVDIANKIIEASELLG